MPIYAYVFGLQSNDNEQPLLMTRYWCSRRQLCSNASEVSYAITISVYSSFQSWSSPTFPRPEATDRILSTHCSRSACFSSPNRISRLSFWHALIWFYPGSASGGRSESSASFPGSGWLVVAYDEINGDKPGRDVTRPFRTSRTFVRLEPLSPGNWVLCGADTNPWIGGGDFSSDYFVHGTFG